MPRDGLREGLFRQWNQWRQADLTERTTWIYNSRRLHEKCGYKTPQAFREEQTKKAA